MRTKQIHVEIEGAASQFDQTINFLHPFNSYLYRLFNRCLTRTCHRNCADGNRRQSDAKPPGVSVTRDQTFSALEAAQR